MVDYRKYLDKKCIYKGLKGMQGDRSCCQSCEHTLKDIYDGKCPLLKDGKDEHLVAQAQLLEARERDKAESK